MQHYNWNVCEPNMECDSDDPPQKPASTSKSIDIQNTDILPTLSPLLQFDIKEILLKNPKGQEILKSIMRVTPIGLSDRRQFNRIMVSHLMEVHGENPSPKAKHEMAKAIVNTFPQQFNDKDNRGHLVWFSRGHNRPATGFLEDRVKNVRKRLKAKGTLDSDLTNAEITLSAQIEVQSIELDEDEIESITDWLKINDSPYEKVKEYMKNTAAARQNWIKSNGVAPVAEIFSMFPRLKDTPGMIEQDFALRYPNNSDNMISNWPRYSETIFEYSKASLTDDKFKKLGFSDPDDDSSKNEYFENACILALPHIIPILNCKIGKKVTKPSLDEVVKTFIHNVPENTDVTTYIKSCKNSSPHVLTIGNRINPSMCYIIVDGFFFPRSSLLKAVDTCFKLFYILDLCYPVKCRWVWEVVQDSFFEIFGNNSNNVSNTVRALRQIFHRNNSN